MISLERGKIWAVGFGFLFVAAASLAADESSAPKSGVKYRQQKDVNFEALLIQGQLKRPEVSVVTGNTPQGADGILRLRENFNDRIAAEIGQEVNP
jgi:hypothetical protein